MKKQSFLFCIRVSRGKESIEKKIYIYIIMQGYLLNQPPGSKAGESTMTSQGIIGRRVHSGCLWEQTWKILSGCLLA